MAEWRPAKHEDVEVALAAGMNEPVGLSHEAVGEMARIGLARSLEVRTYFVGGQMVAVMGLLADSLLGVEGHIWMMTLPEVRHHKFALIREAKRFIREQPFLVVTCLCDPDFKDTQRWVRWMGFTLRGQVHIVGKSYDFFEKAV